MRIVRFLCLGFFLAACTAFSPGAAAFETAAKQVIIVEHESGAEMFAKNADELVQPASMAKLMTAYLLFERLKGGALSLEDELPVSERAWRKGGSKMFVEVGSRVKVEDLIRGIVVQSGNDACIVVAEALAGSVEAFAQQMTEKARALGMNNTTFRNASGWPHPEQLTTVRDIATLGAAIIRDFPLYYHYYSEISFTYNGIKQGNRNPLLYKDLGADGLKTGHVEASGYGLAASAIRGDRRLVMVAHGMESMRQRANETERLIDWAFREFDVYPLFAAGDTVTEARVWLGAEERVPLLVSDPVVAAMKRTSRRDLRVVVQMEEPIPAPITKGMQVGTLLVSAPEMEPISRPLIVGQDVEKLGGFGRIRAALGYLVWGAGQ